MHETKYRQQWQTSQIWSSIANKSGNFQNCKIILPLTTKTTNRKSDHCSTWYESLCGMMAAVRQVLSAKRKKQQQNTMIGMKRKCSLFIILNYFVFLPPKKLLDRSWDPAKRMRIIAIKISEQLLQSKKCLPQFTTKKRVNSTGELLKEGLERHS